MSTQTINFFYSGYVNIGINYTEKSRISSSETKLYSK
jgi:hypothetical protein